MFDYLLFVISALVAITPLHGCYKSQEQRGVAEDSIDVIPYIAHGYRANLDAFSFGRARLRVTFRALAMSVDDGLRQNWLEQPEPVVGEFFWVEDGPVSRMDYLFPKETTEKYTTGSGGRGWQQFVSRCTLRDSQREILYFVNESAHLDWVGTRTQRPWSPFNLGIGAPLDEQIARRPVRYEGEKELNGKKLPVLYFHGPGTQDDRIWIDPDVGFSPVRVETYFPPDTEPHVVTIADDFVECSGGRWMARLSRQVTRRIRKTGGPLDVAPFDVTEHVVNEFDFDNKPDSKLLGLQVARGTWISNGLIEGHPGFKASNGFISLDDFGDDGHLKDGRSGYEALPPRRHAVPAVTESDESRWPFASSTSSTWHTIGIALVGFLVLLTGAILWWKQRI